MTKPTAFEVERQQVEPLKRHTILQRHDLAAGSTEASKIFRSRLKLRVPKEIEDVRLIDAEDLLAAFPKRNRWRSPVEDLRTLAGLSSTEHADQSFPPIARICYFQLSKEKQHNQRAKFFFVFD